MDDAIVTAYVHGASTRDIDRFQGIVERKSAMPILSHVLGCDGGVHEAPGFLSATLDDI